jgi:hypothetical protein
VKPKTETVPELEWPGLDPEVRAAALRAGYERSERFARMTQRKGAPMSYGSGKAPTAATKG